MGKVDLSRWRSCPRLRQIKIFFTEAWKQAREEKTLQYVCLSQPFAFTGTSSKWARKVSGQNRETFCISATQVCIELKNANKSDSVEVRFNSRCVYEYR